VGQLDLERVIGESIAEGLAMTQAKKCQMDKSRCSWRGRSHEVIEGEVTITSKRSRGQLVPEADELLSGDEVQEVEAHRGKF
jgi:hypothetical protein